MCMHVKKNVLAYSISTTLPASHNFVVCSPSYAVVAYIENNMTTDQIAPKGH